MQRHVQISSFKLQPMPGVSATIRSRGKSSLAMLLTLAAMSLGYGVVQLDVTIVNVALKPLDLRSAAEITGLQWVVNAYTVVFASLILTSGALGDVLAIEACKASPMLPLSFFRNRTFTAASMVALLINLAFYGLFSCSASISNKSRNLRRSSQGWRLCR